MPIRVRFAPSPTGLFSLGNARTALFNWLFAKQNKGQFLLRIEDTDKKRSEKKFEKDVLNGLEWLGLRWDEEIIYQSTRLKLYESYLQKLLQEKKAYYCACSQEKLEIEHQAQLSQGLPPKYSGHCRNLNLKSGVIRFKMPEDEITFNDLIKGKVNFKTALIGDIIIAKSLSQPLYNFAVVVDDFEMDITHVIRGEDHLSNTPKQIMLQRAFDIKMPYYAHLPLILGKDRKKLSKRYLQESISDYQMQGYLPQAFINFLVLLGWHPKEDREVLNLSEMMKEFSLERVQKGGAIFNPEKLDWLNAYYIKNLDQESLLEYLKPFLPSYWFKRPTAFLYKIIEVEKERLKHLNELPDLAEFFFKLPDYSKELLIWQTAPVESMLKNLKMSLEIIQNIPDEEFSKDIFESKLQLLAKTNGMGDVFWPLRVAISGQKASPGPIEIIEVLGKDETIKRIEKAIKKLK